MKIKIQITIPFLCGLISTFVPRANAQEWRKIVPLKSTRGDVERLLGPGDRLYGVVYELKDGVLWKDYSSGPCRKEKRGGWNVPEGVVISFRFSAKNKQRETELKLNRKKFRRVIDTHTGGVTYHINDGDGIMYEIQQGRVEGVEYYPPKRYDYLYCGDPSDEKPQRLLRRAHRNYTYITVNTVIIKHNRPTINDSALNLCSITGVQSQSSPTLASIGCTLARQ